MLDALLHRARGLRETAEQAQRLIIAGAVRVDGVRHDKPGQSVQGGRGDHAAGGAAVCRRGGLKLAAALDAFTLDVAGLVAVDVGAAPAASPTVCFSVARRACLRHRCRLWPACLEAAKRPARHRARPHECARLAALPDGVHADLAVIDASFIGLAQVLPATLRLLQPGGQVIALVKPQFEAATTQVRERPAVSSATRQCTGRCCSKPAHRPPRWGWRLPG